MSYDFQLHLNNKILKFYHFRKTAKFLYGINLFWDNNGRFHTEMPILKWSLISVQYLFKRLFLFSIEIFPHSAEFIPSSSELYSSLGVRSTKITNTMYLVIFVCIGYWVLRVPSIFHQLNYKKKHGQKMSEKFFLFKCPFYCV